MNYDVIVIGSGAGNVRDKSIAQHMKALRADTRDERSRVRFSGLSRTEAGL